MKKICLRSRLLMITGALLALTGCTSIPNSATVSPQGFPNISTDAPRSNMQQINMVKLRMDKPPIEVLGPGDVLGIYIASITGNEQSTPPVYNIDAKSEEKPASGYPYPVRADGTISLPLLAEPIYVEGMSIIEAENAIRTAYTIKRRLLATEANISVTLIRKRTYHVCVIREDVSLGVNGLGSSGNLNTSGGANKGESYFGSVGRGSAISLELPAYKNDILEALSRSGGMPGLNAKNELVILRKSKVDNFGTNDDYLAKDAEAYAKSVSDHYNQTGELGNLGSDLGIIRIPLRVEPDEIPPKLTSEDVTLYDGDVIFIESRDAEVFYTGGLIKGGVFPIPRDYDLDVLGAIATAGGGIGAGVSGGGNTATGRSNFLLAPSRILVLRNINGRQLAIQIRQKEALLNPQYRILIEPNDVVLMEYTNFETIFNIIFSTINISINPNDWFNKK